MLVDIIPLFVNFVGLHAAEKKCSHGSLSILCPELLTLIIVYFSIEELSESAVTSSLFVNVGL